ncbi:MAG: hypothetical protein CMJ31_13270 [Phycisphaerae bacterium]|nr:hypothetical protein [Phycisphaerae bacterium]
MLATITCAALLVLLTGCATYTIEVENKSQRPVDVLIEQDQMGDASIQLANRRMEKGAKATLGPFEVPATDPMSLRVRDAGDEYSVPERIRLEAGVMRFVIEDGPIDAWAKMRVVELPPKGDKRNDDSGD